ncbi:MAG: UDP-N-acetylglucosamine 2-epimerase [Eubacteriales bacterium]|nr:UDP-N-acetylglucosamine 2-epimerase [Eubacteriales bacterium]
MKKICVITSTRADYGLLRPLILKIRQDTELELQLVVTGMHLSSEFGMTEQEIIQENIPISKRIEILLGSDTPSAVSKSMGLAMIGFADYLKDNRPDMAVILGDRFEIFAAGSALVNERIPIAHLYGGETTEGAVDECFRHAITKMSHIHFVSNETHRKRVIQLGEHPDHVFNTGSTGIENILNTERMPLKELETSLGFSLSEKPFALVTFHPVTLENDTARAQCEQLFRALDAFPFMNFIFTKANADDGGREINRMIDRYAAEKENMIAVTSLGMKRYLSALSHAAMAIGNSSSGIIEVPSFGIPTVNIGDRQKGRLQAESILNTLPDSGEITAAIKKSNDPVFRSFCKNVKNLYGNGNASNEMLSVMKKFLFSSDINMKKKFYDVEFKVNP